MRALALAALAAAILWFSFKMLPREAAAGPEPVSTGEAAPVQPDAPGPAVDAAPVATAATAAPAPRAASVVPAAPDPVQRTPWAGETLEIARMLVHAEPAALEQRLAQAAPDIPEARRKLLLSFSRAIAGEIDAARLLASGLEGSDEIRPAERRALDLALGRDGVAALPASAGPDTPLVLAMELALLEREARVSLEAGRPRLAARALSELLLGELDAPWTADRAALARWSAELARAQESWRWSPTAGWPSFEEVVAAGDSLTTVRARAVASHPGLRVCTGLIEKANHLKPVIHPGQKLRIPSDPASVVVDLDACWLLYRLGDEVVAAWEVATGRAGSETPPGEYLVGELREEPMWFRPGKEPLPYGHPENPLGTRWIGWNTKEGGKTSLGFHGTSDPKSIGTAASDGCIRLRNEDVEVLYKILPRESPILVRP